LALPVTDWALAYGLAVRPGQPVSPIEPGPGFDPDHAMKADLSRPVIVATLPRPGRDGLPVLIDGSHRLYRAVAEHRPVLPAYLLTAHETAKIMSATLRPWPRLPEPLPSRSSP
jgi:hypothetical protein